MLSVATADSFSIRHDLLTIIQHAGYSRQQLGYVLECTPLDMPCASS